MNETANTAVAVADEMAAAVVGSDVIAAMPTALALFLNDALFKRVSDVAVRMSKADGITPRHLIGKPEACFAVVSRAITWRLDPFAVATATYQTPGGQIGYEGKLIHAIIENSGKLDPRSNGIRYEHYGDWSRVQGKFAIRESKNDPSKKYPVPTWTDDDARAGKPTDATAYPYAQSCGVRVIAHIRGETKPRTLDFDLVQAQPRNSTLWSTDPMQQICYTAVRRFANAVVPSLIMGVPFDPMDNFAPPIDVTPNAANVDDMNAEIRKATPTPAPATQPTDPTTTTSATPPAVNIPTTATYAETRAAIEKAATGDAVNVARDLIRFCPPQFQAELTERANARETELQNGRLL